MFDPTIPSHRWAAFLFLCIPMRLLLVYIAKFGTHIIKKILALALIFPAIAWLYLFFSNSRLNAFEAGGNTWWNSIRPIHAILYIIACKLLLQNKSNAFLPLLLDVIIGLIAFFHNHL